MTNIQENNARLAYIILEKRFKSEKNSNNGEFKIIFDNINKSEYFTCKMLDNKLLMHRMQLRHLRYMINMINIKYLPTLLEFIFKTKSQIILDCLFDTYLVYKPEMWNIIISHLTIYKLEGDVWRQKLHYQLCYAN